MLDNKIIFIDQELMKLIIILTIEKIQRDKLHQLILIIQEIHLIKARILEEM